MSNYIIYLLINTCNNKTYVGITNNKERRIRQHNGELVGGAKYTTCNKDTGSWIYYGWIEPIDPNNVLIKNIALSLEKRIKIKSKKLKGTPIERRMNAIMSLLEQPMFNNLVFVSNV